MLHKFYAAISQETASTNLKNIGRIRQPAPGPASHIQQEPSDCRTGHRIAFNLALLDSDDECCPQGGDAAVTTLFCQLVLAPLLLLLLLW
jgi:hypothetical protein